MGDIVLSGVTKEFEDSTVAVRDLDLDIPDGAFMVLVGPSGCGKTTTLRMVAGLEDVTSGDISVNGKRINKVDPVDRNMAMVFQNYALYPHMTVFENMSFGLRLRGCSKQETRKTVEEAASTLEIGELLDRKPGALSGGQRQRVAMGRAIVRDPSVFLMDEPLSNLDAKLRVQMRTKVAQIQRRLKTTTLYVTHDQTEAMTMGNLVAVLKDGELQQVDVPQVLYDEPQNMFVAGFVGTPAMNLIRGEVIHDEQGTAVSFGSARFNAEQGRFARSKTLGGYVGTGVVVGIRPESVHDAQLHPDGERFEATVEVRESMGSAVWLHCDLGVERITVDEDVSQEAGDERLLTSVVEAKSTAQEGHSIQVSVRPDDLYVFDQESGERIV